MNIIIEELAGLVDFESESTSGVIKSALSKCIDHYSDDFVQDMTHISLAANYAGNIEVDAIIHVKDNLFRCDYSYDWAIGWTCSGTQEAGRIQEKVRFRLSPKGELEFKFLKLEI